MKFKMALFKEDIWLLSDFDLVQGQLEEFQIQLKRLGKEIINDVEVQEQVQLTNVAVSDMLAVIEKWLDAQKAVVTLDQIFSHPFIAKTLVNDYKKLVDAKKIYKHNVSSKAVNAASLKHFFQDISLISESLERVISKTTLIQKGVEDFLETKRLAFPRFFFMTDKQFLEFIELTEQGLDFNKFINLLFPGAFKVFLD